MKNQIKMGVVLSYCIMIVQNLITIFLTPIILRILGKSEYGLYQLVFSTVSYLSLLSFGFGSAYMRFYSKSRVSNDENAVSKLNGMFMTVFFIISILSLFFGMILVLNVENIFKNSLTIQEISTARILMILMVFNIAISFPSSVFDSFVTAQEKFIFQKLLILIQNIANPILTLPLLLMGYKSIALVLVSTVLTLLKAFVNSYYCLRKLNMTFVFGHMDLSLFKEIAVFSSYIFLNIIVDQINWSVDKFLIGMISGTTAVAIYSIGGQINSLFMNLSCAVSNVFIPKVNKMIIENVDDVYLTKLFTKIGRIQFMILCLVLCGFVILGKYFLFIWAGNGYEDSYYIALVLIIPVTVPLIQNIGIEIQRAKNQHKFRSIVYFVMALVNVIISIPLIMFFGEIGAAIGTAIGITVGNIILMNWYYHKYVGIDILYFWKSIASLLPSILIAFTLTYILSTMIKVNTILNFLFIGIVLIVIYCIFLYTMGMKKKKKKIVKSLLNK